MKPFPVSLLEQLDFESALVAEVQAERNLLPTEPWTGEALNRPADIAQWVGDRLHAGWQVAANSVVNARKFGLGTRPVPIMGIVERTAYRALTDYVLRDFDELDRSASAYQQFVVGPIYDATPDNGVMWRRFGATEIDYVVETDIVAFYQYIDHEILRQELEIQTGEVEAIALLIDLLSEIQQRSFGLPQLVDSSDRLSEVYISIVERTLARKGWPVWRFNDDFRINCRTYTEALDAIEQLDEAARQLGLTLSEHKTYTPRFLTYLTRNLDIQIDEKLAETQPFDVETIVGTYTELDSAISAESARTVFSSLGEPSSPQAIAALRAGKAGQFREIRRALAVLTRENDTGAVPYIEDTFTYMPSLAAEVCNYLIALGKLGVEGIDSVVDQFIERVSMGEWQAMWVIRVLRESPSEQSDARTIWVRRQRDRGRGRPLGAEASLALAEVRECSFDELDQALLLEPSALAPWHLAAMRALEASGGTDLAKRVGAVAGISPMHKLLLGR